MNLSEKYKSLFEKNGINTPLRKAHFLAQLEHESGGFKYLTELGGRSYFNKYEGRKDLGNTQAGDGYKFRGRGYIQVTGRANYTELSKDTGIDFVSNPDLLSQEANAIVSALWFWSKRNLNALADFTGFKENPKTKQKDDALVLITRKVNGGVNGLDHRRELFNKYKKEFGI